ncbi:MAG: nucleotide exchange factor GrpE, partial [Candidatus Aenigmarchaeota archaeon]|nr:nucleotide exchange factor GrpE [Candidatus Aenigmarchaeota archaeon]
EPEGTVLQELQKGYMLNSKIIRHAKVKIAKKKEN